MNIRPAHEIRLGDALTVLRSMESESVQCCVTSPPYFGLRDYGTASWDISNAEDAEIAETCDHKGEPMRTRAYVNQNTSEFNDVKNAANHQPMKDICTKCGAIRVDAQIGLEATPAEFVAKMVEVFEEVRRVLKKDGTLWLNLGDSYAGSWGNYHPNSPPGKHGQRKKDTERFDRPGYASQEFLPPTSNAKGLGLKAKDLIGIPWRVAFALQEAGWWLRQDIIWSKPNPMPESVTDRCTKAHEYMFLLTKSAKYFYDAEAVKEESSTNDMRRPYGSEGAWAIDGRPVEMRGNGKPRGARTVPRLRLDRKSSPDRTISRCRYRIKRRVRKDRRGEV